MDARKCVETLNGRPLKRVAADSWSGFFVGSIGVEIVREIGDAIRFDLVGPTAESDIDDYISTR
jgi:hypothetical protein